LLRRLGVDARPEDMRLTVPPSGREYAEGFRRERGLSGGDYVVVAPPTRWVTKLYPVRHWRRVVAGLAKEMPVAVVGAPSEEERRLCREIAVDQGEAVVDLAGQTSIPQLVGLVAGSAGVVCCDSATKFIAPAVGVGCVTLMGPTRVKRTGPFLRGKALVADVPCQGCLKKRCSHISCMQSISPDLVLETALPMIRGGR
jgi:ADP-heptose:LPS heptosyltransferase